MIFIKVKLTEFAIDTMLKAIRNIQLKNQCEDGIDCLDCLLCGISEASDIGGKRKITQQNIDSIIEDCEFEVKYGELSISNEYTVIRTHKNIKILTRQCNICKL